jgi:hypothetical protein
MSNLAAYGVTLELPAGWDGRIAERPGGLAVAHAATFPLPAQDGDFALGTTQKLPAGGVVVALVEYERALADTPLFAVQGPPGQLAAADFSPVTLLRRVAGQSGLQRFFTSAGRAFCLYVVVGSSRPSDGLAAQASAVASTLQFSS